MARVGVQEVVVERVGCGVERHEPSLCVAVLTLLGFVVR